MTSPVLTAIRGGHVATDRVRPLTALAERHGACRGSVSDIWLPDVLARTLPACSGALVALAIVLHLRGTAGGRRAGRARRSVRRRP